MAQNTVVVQEVSGNKIHITELNRTVNITNETVKVISVAAQGPPGSLPSLTYGKLWVGGTSNSAIESRVLHLDEVNTRLGINTTSPDQDLHVNGNVKITGALYDSNNSPGNNAQVLSSTGTTLDWINISEISGISGSGTENYLAKWDDAAGLTDSLVYSTLTDVGINIANPSALLHVQRSSGVIFKVGTGSANSNIFIHSEAPNELRSDGSLILHSDRANTHSNSSIAFKVDNNTKMSIISSGNVGIGTTTPSEVLEVDGIIKTNHSLKTRYGITLDDSSYSDLAIVNKTISSGYIRFITHDGPNSPQERLRITNSGNVGIGITSPAYRLDVGGNIRINNTIYNAADNTTYFGFSGNDAITFQTNGKPHRLYINGSGNVGIGTSSPLNGFAGSNTLTLNGVGDAGTYSAAIGFNINSGNAIGFIVADTSSLILQSSTEKNIVFKYGGGYEAARIDTYGNLGIGTTSPNSTLHVHSTTGLRVSSAGNASIYLQRDQNNAYSALLKYYSGNTLSWVAGLSDSQDFTESTGAEYFIGTDKNTPKFLINSSGNVGIGVNSPSDKLNVAGSVNISKSASGAESDSNALKLSYEDDTAVDGDLSLTANPTGTSTNFVVTDTRRGELFRVNDKRITWSSGEAQIYRANEGSPYNFYGSSDINLYTGSTSWASITTESKPLYLGTVDKTSAHLVIDTTGKVGIGTTVPGNYKLNISHNSTGPNNHLDSGLLVNGNQANIYIKATTVGSTNGLASLHFGDANGLNSSIRAASGYSEWLLNGDQYIQLRDNFYYGLRLGIQDPPTGTYKNVSVTPITTHADRPVLSIYGNDSHTADILQVYGDNTLDTLRFLVNADGNVGIGIDAPSAKLHISGSDPRIRLTDIDGTNYHGDVYQQNGALKIESRNGTSFGNINFQGNNGTTQKEYARFNSSGFLGIGTNSPGALLDLQGQAGGQSTFLKIKSTNSSAEPMLQFDNNLNTLGKIGGVNGGGLMFKTLNDVEAMRITADGKLGIGWTAPPGKLSVSGGSSAGNNDTFCISSSAYNGNLLNQAHSPHVITLLAGKAETGGSNLATSLKLVNVGTETAGGTFADIRSRAYGEIDKDITNLVNFKAEYRSWAPPNGPSTLTNHYGVQVLPLGVSANGTVTNNYGIYLSPGTTATNNWGVYQSGSSVNNFFEGNLGIGTNSPSAKLHVYGSIKATLASSTTTKVVYYDTTSQELTYGDAPSIDTPTLQSVTDAGNSTSTDVTFGNVTVSGDLTVQGSYTQIDTNVNTTEQWNVTNDGTGPAVTINQKGAQDIMDVQDDGTSVFYIKDGGNVGIGTNSPSSSYKLDVSGDARVSNLRIEPTGTINFNHATVSTQTSSISSPDGNKLSLNSSYWINLVSNNSINLKTPSFYITGDVTESNGFVFKKTTTPVANNTTFHIGQDFSTPIGISGRAKSVTQFFINRTIPDSTGKLIDFQEDGSSRFVIDSAGNVGIGTTAPSEKLQIDGAIRATDVKINTGSRFFRFGGSTISILSSTETAVTNTATNVAVGRLGLGSTYSQIDIGAHNKTNQGYTSAIWATSGRDALRIYSSSNSQALTFTEDGNLGIGTTAPSAKTEIVTTDVIDAAETSIGLKVNADQTGTVGTGGGTKYGVVIESSQNFNKNIGTRAVGLYIPAYDGTVYAGSLSAHFEGKLYLGGDNTLYSVGPYGLLTLDGTHSTSNLNDNTIFIQGIGTSNEGGVLGGITTGLNTANLSSAIHFVSGGFTRQSHIVFKASSDGSLTERMRITSDGNIGIGTTSPDTALHLASSTTTGPTLRFSTEDNNTGRDDINGTIEFETRDGSNTGVNASIVGIQDLAGEGAIALSAGAAGSLTQMLTVKESAVIIGSDSSFTTIKNKPFDGSSTTGERLSILQDPAKLYAINIVSEDNSATTTGIGFNPDGVRAPMSLIAVENAGLRGEGHMHFVVKTGDATYDPADLNDSKMVIKNSGNIGIGTTSPDASAILDIASTTQGVLFPRMTEGDRTSIGSPATGLIVYQTDGDEGLYIYKSTGWIQII